MKRTGSRVGLRTRPTAGAPLPTGSGERSVRAWVGSDVSLAGCVTGTTTSSPWPPGRSPTASSSPRADAARPHRQRADPPVDRRRQPADRRRPPALPAGRRGRGGVARRVRVRRLLAAASHPQAGPPGARAGTFKVPPPGGHRGLRARADRLGVHLRRPHAPRDPDRPLGRRTPPRRRRSCCPCSRPAAPTRRSSTASTGPTTCTTSSWPATRPWRC